MDDLHLVGLDKATQAQGTGDNHIGKAFHDDIPGFIEFPGNYTSWQLNLS